MCVGLSVTGCSRTHSVTLGDWSDPLDPDVETQTIFKQLIQGRDKLRSVDQTFLEWAVVVVPSMDTRRLCCHVEAR